MKNSIKKIWRYLLVVLVISLTIVVIQNINGHEKDIPKVVQDINSGVIGAILTTIITLLLLSNQTDLQEIQTKNSVIYEEKLKLFNEFLNVLSKSLEDGKLAPEELKSIIFQYSIVRIHISVDGAKKIENAIQSIDEEFFYVDENYVPRFDRYIELFTGICNVLRHELYQSQEDKSLPPFAFDNFLKIAYQHRAVKLPINSFDDVLEAFKKTRSCYIDDKKGNKIQFELHPDHIKNLTEAYYLIQKITSEFSNREIDVRFLLHQYNVNGKIYLGVLNIYYSEGETQIATLGVSSKNRIFFKIKLEKVREFQFETDTVVADYEHNIRKDLSYFLASKQTQSQKPTNPEE
jgi:hypothetical protein